MEIWKQVQFSSSHSSSLVTILQFTYAVCLSCSNVILFVFKLVNFVSQMSLFFIVPAMLFLRLTLSTLSTPPRLNSVTSALWAAVFPALSVPDLLCFILFGWNFYIFCHILPRFLDLIIIIVQVFKAAELGDIVTLHFRNFCTISPLLKSVYVEFVLLLIGSLCLWVFKPSVNIRHIAVTLTKSPASSILGCRLLSVMTSARFCVLPSG